MQFNDNTNKSGVIQQCERYCNLVGRITGDTLKEFTAYVNKTNREVWRTIFSVYGGWQYDDSNYSDYPISTRDIGKYVNDYVLPEESLTLRRVEIQKNGIWKKLKPITDEEIPVESELLNEKGMPEYYKLLNGVIILYPTPDFDETAGLKVYYDRGSVNFVNSDTTKQAGFNSEFHDILPIGASITYWTGKPQGNDTYAKLREEYQIMLQAIKNFYYQRFCEKFPPKIKLNDTLREYI